LNLSTFYEARKTLKEKRLTAAEIGYEGNTNYIFINKSLTQLNGELFKTFKTRLEFLKTPNNDRLANYYQPQN